MDIWELTARERIRDTLARYNWSGDAMRLPELTESFCEDGELELRRRTPVRDVEPSSSFSVAQSRHRTRRPRPRA